MTYMSCYQVLEAGASCPSEAEGFNRRRWGGHLRWVQRWVSSRFDGRLSAVNEAEGFNRCRWGGHLRWVRRWVSSKVDGRLRKGPAAGGVR